ncbi:MAG TPA: PfaD family polyunsaturated fatty acid/polyketide biosynthesis protein [Verrucomicrobiae bacterium]|nr:PfaD family polyunsaturated fatty acid/polyketide biosynthesis protein [Verrucomicrobiae bacterium]
MSNAGQNSESLLSALAKLDTGYRVHRKKGKPVLMEDAAPASGKRPLGVLILPANPERTLGSAAFREAYQVRYNLMAGGMAHGISSEELVLAMGRAGFLAVFGAAGLSLERIEQAIHALQTALPRGPFGINFIHTPGDPADESRRVALFLKRGVRIIEASAFFGVTPALVHYRAAGLQRGPDGGARIQNRIIAKVSRKEVAAQFLAPPPVALINTLAQQGLITPEQAALARTVPMADDLTVEADSAGHTDKAAWICLLPAMIQLRDRAQAGHRFAAPVRIGSAGGIGTPAAVSAAFFLGADYVVTGSINQAALEAGTSTVVKQLLAKAEPADVTMAPAADMFELGVQVQVLKRGTFFPARARKLYEWYRNHASYDAIPKAQRDEIESKFFRASAGEIWSQVRDYFAANGPEMLVKAQGDPKFKMALLFRWYLGQSSFWAIRGDSARAEDYQVWCGPAMGAFNEWVRGTSLESPAGRRIVDISLLLLQGAAFANRCGALASAGFCLPAQIPAWRPPEPAG